MLAILAGFLVAGAVGWVRAGRRGGTTGDKLQFALAHGVPAALLVLIVQVLVLRIGFGLPPDLFSQ